MFKPLIDSYSAVLKKFKGKDIGATINEEVNIDRLKTMYDGYDGDRVIEIRFIDPRRFTVQQRNFIYALIGDIFIDTGMPTDFWKEFFYFRFEGVTGRKISLKDESSTTVSDANILANIILDFIFEHHIPFKEGYEILPANQEYYFYKCITKRVCCICGKTGADIDHFDKALGRRKRKEVDHSEYTFAALCRIHHTEKHKICGGEIMDLITQYSDIILKKIMMKIQKDKKSKERAELVKLEMAETGAGVRSSRHWKAAANIEFYYNEIQKGFDQMRELDRQTNWSKKLHQDRFKFVERYREILNEYFEED
ncbi:DUF1140 family protein [Enterococcus faecium]|nr:DUF1140 family protein [Enterococcus faecium]